MERSVSFLGSAAIRILGPISMVILVSALVSCMILSMYRRKQRKTCDEIANSLAHMRFESMDEITVRRGYSDDGLAGNRRIPTFETERERE